MTGSGDGVAVDSTLAMVGVGVMAALGVVGMAIIMMRQANNRTSKPPQPTRSLPLMPDLQSLVMRCMVCLSFRRAWLCVTEH